MFSFFRKKPTPRVDLYSLEYNYEQLLKMSQDVPEDCVTVDTDDFEVIFIDYGTRRDAYTNEEIPMGKIIYTSKEEMVFSAADKPQIHYGVIEVEDGYQVHEVLKSSDELPDQVRALLKSKLYAI